MNFDFSDDQKLLREHARQFLAQSCGFDRLRRHMATGEVMDRELWQQMVELGWAALTVPEAAGGMGLGLLELCVLSEETGRSLAPVPFFDTVCVGVEMLRDSAFSGAQMLLAGITRGETIVAAALQQEQGELVAGARGLTGRVVPVAYAGAATHLVTAARGAAGEALLVLVDLAQPGVARSRCPRGGMDDLIAHGEIVCTAAAFEVLHAGAAAETVLRRILDQAAVLVAFEQVGAADAACAMAREYVMERYVFGRPVGGYQAIKHKLADALVDIELARSNAWYGAWAMATGAPDLERAAALARISATAAAVRAAEENLQVHGGIGYTWEANCHFYYRRARLLAISLGDSAHWSERLLSGI